MMNFIKTSQRAVMKSRKTRQPLRDVVAAGYAVAALTVSLLLKTDSVSAADMTRTIQYHTNSQPTIYCAAALVCEIRLASGEKITGAWNAQAQIWFPDGGMANGRPIITLKPEAPGLRTNFVVLTDKREYDMWLVSYDGAKKQLPFRTDYAYDDEARLLSRHRDHIPKAFSTPPPTSAPLTTSEQMDAACAKMPADEQYTMDAEPASLHPEAAMSRNSRSVCHTLDSTYIQMPTGGANPSDLPSIVEGDGRDARIVNYTYDPVGRIFRIDDVASEYTLVEAKGRNTSRLRIQRRVDGNAAISVTSRKATR